MRNMIGPSGSSVAERSALGPTGRWFEPSSGGTLRLNIAPLSGKRLLLPDSSVVERSALHPTGRRFEPGSGGTIVTSRIGRTRFIPTEITCSTWHMRQTHRLAAVDPTLGGVCI